MKVFKSRVDGWLAMVAFGVPVVGISIPLSKLGVSVKALPPIAIVAAALMFEAWLFTTVQYRIEEGELRVRAAFLRWNIPIRDIRSITPTRNPSSSPALSLDRLSIVYGDKEILVSPIDKYRFIEVLRAVNSRITAPESSRW